MVASKRKMRNLKIDPPSWIVENKKLERRFGFSNPKNGQIINFRNFWYVPKKVNIRLLVFFHSFFAQIFFFSKTVHIYPLTNRVKKRVSKRVSPRVMHRIRSETLGKTLGETFRAKECRQESCRESLARFFHRDSPRVSARLLARLFAPKSRQESCRECRIGSYAWLSARLSPKLVFLRGYQQSL